MPTLGDLRARIISETNRDDLGDVLASNLDLAIQGAIAQYANERFWYNEAETTTAFVPNNQYLPLPTGQHIVDAFYVVIGNVRYKLTKRSMEYIEDQYTTPQFGQPTDYCEFLTNARVWPCPQIAYPAIWLTVSDVTPLDYTDPTSSNYWTNEAYDLTTAQAKLRLFRDQFRDADGAELSKAQMSEAYENIKGESNRRVGTGRIRSRW